MLPKSIEELVPDKIPAPGKKKKEYINNSDFVSALMEHKRHREFNKEHNMPAPQLSNYIGECFMKIAEGLSHTHKFINYSYREEMKADGIENCLMYYHNFDPLKSNNAFAYFTQIIYYAFLRRIAKEKKQLYVKYKATQQMGILDEMEFLEMENGNSKQFEMYDNISEFIENYEVAKANKKVAKKPKGIENFLKE